MPRLSLRSKFLIALLVVLLPMLGLIVYDYNAEYSQFSEAILAEQVRASQYIAALAESSIDDALSVAWSFSKNPLVQSGDPGQIDLYLQSLDSFLPQFDDIAVFDAEGRNTGSMKLRLLPGESRPGGADRAYFQSVKATGRAAVSNVLVSKATENPIVVAAVPMTDGQGGLRGVTMAALDMDGLAQSLAGAEFRKSQVVFMVDPEGTVAFHTGLAREEWGRRSLSDYPPVRSALGGAPARERRMAAPQGDERIVAAVRTPRYGWVVGLSVPTSEVLQPLRAGLALRALLYTVAMLLAGLVAILMSGRLILGPLGALTDHLVSLGRGQLDRRLELRTGDEMEAIGNQANRMAGRLQEFIRERDALLQQALEARRKSEESADLARRWSEEVEGLLASLTEGVTIVDGQGEILLMNETGRAIWKLTSGELTSERHRRLRLCHLDGRRMSFEEWPIRRALMGERFDGYEVLYEQDDGERMILSFSGSAVLDQDRRVKMAINVYRDVTRLRQMERQREDYLRIVAHDLRAPLTIVQGQAQLLQRDLERAGLEGRAPTRVEAILIGARRMNVMIQDLVDAVRLEAGQLRLERRPLELRAFVSDLLGRASDLLDTRRIRVEIPENLPPVDADPDRLERVLINLLSNALKYSPQESEVVVSAEWRDEGVMATVVDDGTGISPEDLPYVFDRFYRAQGVRKAEGLGLGLYITRMLVEAQGGRIWVDSQVGKGSSFSFLLPAVDGLAGPPGAGGEL